MTDRRHQDQFPETRLEVLAPLGRGSRCEAFLARQGGTLLVLKRYLPAAVRRHARCHGQDLARYEFERNLAVRSCPALLGVTARPVAWRVDGSGQHFLQEYVEGVDLATFCARADLGARARLLAELRRIVAAAHGAGIHDLDLHPGNLRVSGPPGEPRVKLFDFNKVPYHLAPPNRAFAWLVRLGLIGPESRDRRHLGRLARQLGVRQGGRLALWTAPLPGWLGEMEPFLLL